MSTTAPSATSLTGETWPAGSDPVLTQPFVDIDEQRDSPVPHRYVHGGFEGTETRFSFYFPAAEVYEGRFFQHVTPVPQSENLAPLATGEEDRIGFSVASGAYFVETNGGGSKAADPFSGMDPTLAAYRVSAEAAAFSRVVAARIYGPHRPYGYLYGGSGGGYRTIGAAENTTGVWDGFVPYVTPTPMSVPSNFSVRMHAQRVLRDVFDDIVDAYDAGGDPGKLQLSTEQRDALTEATRMGFPPRSWFGWRTMGMHGFSAVYPGVVAADPTYADDFWSTPGYLGAEPGASVHDDRMQLHTTITDVLTAGTATGLPVGGVDESFLHAHGENGAVTGIRLADTPQGWAQGAILTVTSGQAAGTVLRLLEVNGDTLIFEPGQDAATQQSLAPGDEVFLDNSTFLAAQTYHRHQVPGPEYGAWDMFRADDGSPLRPQRPMLLGPAFASFTAGTVPTGAVSEKMIAVLCLLDREAFPWHGDWLRQAIANHLGEDASSHFRLWYIDNALHGDSEEQEYPTRTVSYLGALQTALRQIAAWVENGVEPAPDSTYQLVDGQVIVPSSGPRGGVQPTASLTVDGAEAVTVRVGETVSVRITADAAAGGIITDTDTDLTGVGEWTGRLDVAAAPRVELATETSFASPGTYFVSVRVTAQTQGDALDPHARVHNIARARIVVQE